MGKKGELHLLFPVCLLGLVQCSGAMLYWTAYLGILFSEGNQTVERTCDCGVYGSSSPLKEAFGQVVVPSFDPLGCGPDPVYSPPTDNTSWIALVKRGNCTFGDKINAAKRQKAAAVVVYNADGTGNSTSYMQHVDAQDIVAVMIGNQLGRSIVDLVNKKVDVTMEIAMGTPHGPWMDTYWLYFMSIGFFVVTAASIAYFVFVSVQRLHNVRVLKRAQLRLKNEAKKAISHLEVRTLKRGDEELISESHTCAICIDSYRAGDVVTVLTCDHFFHKACIEPWLLEKRTCPMCKCDILKALGVEEVPEEQASSSMPPPDVTVVTVSGGQSLYEVPLSEPATPHPVRAMAWEDPQQLLYDNLAFEGDSATRSPNATHRMNNDP
ncbi:E3 ubiquitin-protein ligase RNF128a [Aplochiton taeniatus]